MIYFLVTQSAVRHFVPFQCLNHGLVSSHHDGLHFPVRDIYTHLLGRNRGQRLRGTSLIPFNCWGENNPNWWKFWTGEDLKKWGLYETAQQVKALVTGPGDLSSTWSEFCPQNAHGRKVRTNSSDCHICAIACVLTYTFHKNVHTNTHTSAHTQTQRG